MQNFRFQNPVKISFGAGSHADMARDIPEQARILILYGGGSVLQNGTMDDIRTVLKDRSVIEFGGIEPNPTYETLMRAVEIARKENVDFLLAVGGGSVIDGTKFVAAAIPFDGDCWEILSSGGRAVKSAISFGVVLTLSATGSEMNNTAVITRASTKDKVSFASARVFPKFAILDPRRTMTLPPRQVGNGVVDAFAHVMEQYLTYPVNAAVQDRFAEGLLLTLIEQGPLALSDPENYDVRANLMWTATMALNGIIGVGVPQDWATHMIGHELTALHGVDHGQSLAIVMPSLMNVMRASKREKLLQYAARVWQITEGSDDLRIDQAIARTRHFFEQMGVKTRLSDYGIAESDIPAIIDQLVRHRLTALGERREITPEIVRQILSGSL